MILVLKMSGIPSLKDSQKVTNITLKTVVVPKCATFSKLKIGRKLWLATNFSVIMRNNNATKIDIINTITKRKQKKRTKMVMFSRFNNNSKYSSRRKRIYSKSMETKKRSSTQ